MRPGRIALLTAGATLAGMTACLDVTSVANAKMSIVSGQGQTGTINQPLPESLRIVIIHNSGLPMKDVTVTWTVVSGGGSVSPAQSITDSLGVTSVQRILGPEVGLQVTQASVDGIGHLNISHNAVAPATP